MSNKLILFLILHAAVFSANALTITSNSGGIPLNLNLPGQTDQVSIFANNNENLANLPTATPGVVPFNQNIAPATAIAVSSTMNRRSGWDTNPPRIPFSLVLFDNNTLTTLFTLDINDYIPSGVLGNFQTVLPALAMGNYEFRFVGQADENSTGLTVRVAAIPVPASVWLFGSAMVALVGIARRTGKRAVAV